MATRLQTRPRKTASQARSRATVDALVEATARVLVKDGYDRASTNRIAAMAGVSIGSLYQYFPSKDALVAAVIQRHRQALAQVALAGFRRAVGLPIEAGLRELVAAGIEGHRVAPKLHRVLAEEVPRSGQRDRMDLIEREGVPLFRDYLNAHRDEIAVADPDLAAFVLLTTLESLTHAAVLRRPDLLMAGKSDAFVAEVAGLLLRYLRPPARGRRATKR